jgi:hypothetical protein
MLRLLLSTLSKIASFFLSLTSNHSFSPPANLDGKPRLPKSKWEPIPLPMEAPTPAQTWYDCEANDDHTIPVAVAAKGCVDTVSTPGKVLSHQVRVLVHRIQPEYKNGLGRAALVKRVTLLWPIDSVQPDATKLRKSVSRVCRSDWKATADSENKIWKIGDKKATTWTVYKPSEDAVTHDLDSEDDGGTPNRTFSSMLEGPKRAHEDLDQTAAKGRKRFRNFEALRENAEALSDKADAEIRAAEAAELHARDAKAQADKAEAEVMAERIAIERVEGAERERDQLRRDIEALYVKLVEEGGSTDP